MKVGIIGIGTLTYELASRAAKAGYEVIVNNPRGNSLVREIISRIGSNVQLGTLDEASSASLVILFVPKDDLEPVIKNLPDMSGKVIIHISNLIFNPQSLVPGISNALTYQITASLLPEADVVKLFNPVKLEKSTTNGTANRDDIFYIAHNSHSKYCVGTFLKNLHFCAIDLSKQLKRYSTNHDTVSNSAVFHFSKNFPKGKA